MWYDPVEFLKTCPEIPVSCLNCPYQGELVGHVDPKDLGLLCVASSVRNFQNELADLQLRNVWQRVLAVVGLWGNWRGRFVRDAISENLARLREDHVACPKCTSGALAVKDGFCRTSLCHI